jgi:hypothetical protein
VLSSSFSKQPIYIYIYIYIRREREQRTGAAVVEVRKNGRSTEDQARELALREAFRYFDR